MTEFAGKTLMAHQIRGTTELFSALEAGEQRLVYTGPTGSGKTLQMGYAIAELSRQGKSVDLITNRRLLLSQLCEVMGNYGIPFGVRAAGMDHLADASKPVQFLMIQSELSKKKRATIYQPRKTDVAFVDEAHNQWGGGSGDFLREAIAAGTKVVSVTATPVGCPSDIGNRLIIAGLNSELRKAGLLLPAYVYAPDEPEAAAKLKPMKTGEYKEGDVVKAIMSPTIFGRVLDWYDRLNPERRPAILFGPGVKESIWFAEQFRAVGIRSAHIDGDKVWIDGETHNKTQSLVDEIANESRLGGIKVVCNRFVLREGLDWPWLFHGILATMFGSLTGYLQSVGRLLRACDGLDHVICQDHGGNYHRHGSPNADRIWNLSWDANRYAQERSQQLREKKEPEPIVCPKCGAVRLHGPSCMTCGHTADVKGRMVVQTDGSLKFVKGDVYQERKVVERNNTEKLWEQCYFRCKNSKQSFSQAYALFFRENHYWPPKNLPYMPREAVDWYAKVKDVPRDNLIPRK